MIFIEFVFVKIFLNDSVRTCFELYQLTGGSCGAFSITKIIIGEAGPIELRRALDLAFFWLFLLLLQMHSEKNKERIWRCRRRWSKNAIARGHRYCYIDHFLICLSDSKESGDDKYYLCAKIIRRKKMLKKDVVLVATG
ncbi:unnamed protein product [Amoebophrya sp. A120]|nr:unnamed protein product [Amoebophrya sp. A120]|eukprot:GSA120T00012673001.1